MVHDDDVMGNDHFRIQSQRSLFGSNISNPLVTIYILVIFYFKYSYLGLCLAYLSRSILVS